MPFTLGDLILMELALTMLMKDMDLSMQCGQQFVEIIGRIEKAIQAIATAQQGAAAGPLNNAMPGAGD